MSFKDRQIAVSIQLQDGTFDGVNDTVTLSDFRVKAQIKVYGGETASILDCQIYGLPLSMMNRLTRIGNVNTVSTKNVIQLSAGNKGEALTTVFIGNIFQAYADMQGAPEVSLNIVAYPSYGAALTPVAASSFTGSTDVGFVMQRLAKLAGLSSFENNGVDVKLESPYFPGTAIRQIQSCAQAADINYLIDIDTLAIWPKYGKRAGDTIVISPETGMVGYPAYSSTGFYVASEFIPNIRFGQQVTVKSSLKPASKEWITFSLLHELESQTPGGAWFTQIEGFPIS